MSINKEGVFQRYAKKGGVTWGVLSWGDSFPPPYISSFFLYKKVLVSLISCPLFGRLECTYVFTNVK